MAKFVMKCPNPECGRYVEASTGFFAKKTMDCACGQKIHVKTDKVASKTCPKCGNFIVYDQSLGDDAKCPVCNAQVNTLEHKVKMAEFSCPTCSCLLSADVGATNYTCPLCDTEISDVQKCIAREKLKRQSQISGIKYEGDNKTFVWKHPVEDFKLGSFLIVHESQEAVLFRDGRALDSYEKGKHILTTQSMPIFNDLYKLPANPDCIFHSEVYFINMTTQMNLKWGTTDKVRLFDPVSGMNIDIGANGYFSLRVSDARRLLIKLVGTESSLKQEDIVGSDNVLGMFKTLIISKARNNLAKVIKEKSINILELDENLDVISEVLHADINKTMEEYGLTIPEFYIVSFLWPEDDPNFVRLRQQYADRVLKVREENIRAEEARAAAERKITEAETEAKLKEIQAKGEAAAHRIKSQAEAEGMQMKGYTYTQETARLVGMEAMKNGVSGTIESGASYLGDAVGMGIAMGTMGSVINSTKEEIAPAIQAGKDLVSPKTDDTSAPMQNIGWNCACGQTGITSKHCPNCGAKKPEETTWNCPNCGLSGLTSNCCPDCGTKKPGNITWDCPECGASGLTSKYCPNCGFEGMIAN